MTLKEQAERAVLYAQKHQFQKCITSSVVDSKGYGHVLVNRKQMLAHRYALGLHQGKSIDASVVVRHMCHNKACCNPLHLRVGSAQDNTDDTRKLRLSDEDIRLIRKSTVDVEVLASMFKLHRTSIRRIQRKLSMKHIGD